VKMNCKSCENPLEDYETHDATGLCTNCLIRETRVLERGIELVSLLNKFGVKYFHELPKRVRNEFRSRWSVRK